MESLRTIDPLVFDEEVVNKFKKFERECNVYQAAAELFLEFIHIVSENIYYMSQY